MATDTEQVKNSILQAESMASMWLHRGNLASERGDREKAERHYNRAQPWLDKANRLRGWGDGTD